MAVASLVVQHPRSDDEHRVTQKVIADFDKALKELHGSTKKLQTATDKYRERLEGTNER